MKIKITADVVMSGEKFQPGAVIDIDDRKAAVLISKGKAIAHSEVFKIVSKTGFFARLKRLVTK